MLLLQPLVFSINRKEREQWEAIGSCCSATELRCSECCVVRFVYCIADTPGFQEAWQLDMPNEPALESPSLGQSTGLFC